MLPASDKASASPLKEDKVDKIIKKMREDLMSDGFYLGDPSTLKKVAWVRDGRADRLAVKHDGKEGDSGAPSGVDLAPLTVIGRIDDNDFWMTPDAGYRKGSSVWGKLADVKASCAVRAADEPGVKSDFATVLKNLGEMQESISRPGYQIGKGFILPDNGSGKRFKIRHILFEVSGAVLVVRLSDASSRAA